MVCIFFKYSYTPVKNVWTKIGPEHSDSKYIPCIPVKCPSNGHVPDKCIILKDLFYNFKLKVDNH